MWTRTKRRKRSPGCTTEENEAENAPVAGTQQDPDKSDSGESSSDSSSTSESCEEVDGQGAKGDDSLSAR